DVTLIASNGGNTDTLILSGSVQVNPTPSVPIISQEGSFIHFTPDVDYVSYQWFDGNQIINGATDTILEVNHDGNYNVEITNNKGCKISVGINIVLTVKDERGRAFSFYPNPVTDR